MTEEALQARLAAHPGVSALAGTRIYPSLIPQDKPLPAVRYARVATTRRQVMGVPTGTADVLMQLDSYATSYAGVRALAAAVRASLERWRQEGTFGVDILDCLPESEQDIYEDDRSEHRVMQTFTLFVRGD